jgi:hypothetical protein
VTSALRRLYAIAIVRVTALGLTTGCTSHAQTAQRNEQLFAERAKLNQERERLGTQFVTVADEFGVSVPPGRFLLARHGQEICAVRFTRHYTARDSRRPGESEYAEYEVYSRRDGGTRFGDEVSRSTGKVGFDPWIGHGVFRGHPASTSIECATFRMAWAYPTSVAFYRSLYQPRDEGIKLAPTAWTGPSHIDTTDGRVVWYRYDPSRRSSSKVGVDDFWRR